MSFSSSPRSTFGADLCSFPSRVSDHYARRRHSLSSRLHLEARSSPHDVRRSVVFFSSTIVASILELIESPFLFLSSFPSTRGSDASHSEGPRSQLSDGLHPWSHARLVRGSCNPHVRDEGEIVRPLPRLFASRTDPFFLHRLIQFLKQANGLDLGKLLSAHMLYWNVSRPHLSFLSS